MRKTKRVSIECCGSCETDAQKLYDYGYDLDRSCYICKHDICEDCIGDGMMEEWGHVQEGNLYICERCYNEGYAFEVAVVKHSQSDSEEKEVVEVLTERK